MRGFLPRGLRPHLSRPRKDSGGKDLAPDIRLSLCGNGPVAVASQGLLPPPLSIKTLCYALVEKNSNKKTFPLSNGIAVFPPGLTPHPRKRILKTKG